MSEMNVINLTPHNLNIYNETGDLVLVVEPAGLVARVAVQRAKMNELDGIPLYTTRYGKTENLPPYTPDLKTVYVVSGMTRAACQNRVDVFQPGELLRNSDGQVIGCVGLSR